MRKFEFSKNYTGLYPAPLETETYANYRKRVDNCKREGFHLGDLDWDDWRYYCMGSGEYNGINPDDLIHFPEY